MKALVVALLLLTLLPLPAFGHDADRERELTILVEHYARSRAREAAEAAKTMADLIKAIEALRADNEALKQKLSTGQSGGGTK